MSIPAGYESYGRTTVFTETTVPVALLKAHTTKEGAWALIQVLEGRLSYRVVDPRVESREEVLTPEGTPGVIEPTILHVVQPLGKVRFYVEFFRMPSDAPATL